MTARRETMLKANGDSGSGIPILSSLKVGGGTLQVFGNSTRPNTMRQSMAPGRTPLARPTTSIAPSTNSRQSLYPNANPLLMSARKGVSTFHQTPARNNGARASLWAGGTMAAVPGLNQPTKDPRPVREKPFQAQISRVISNFLASTGSPIQLSPKIYASPPTSQQYWTVVDWLIRQLDPEYPEPRQGGFAIGPNEYIGVLRWLRYPFVDAIDKKSLSTVGGLHSWPAMLAALHYLVSLVIAQDNYTGNKDDATLQNLDHIPEQFFEEAHHSAFAFYYYDCAYGSFLAGEDEFPQEREALEARYAKKDEQIIKDLESQRALHSELSAELSKLNSAPAPVLQLREEWKAIQRDREKVDNWHQHSEKRILKYQEELSRELQETNVDEATLKEITEEQANLDLQVAEQNLSAEEVARMNAEGANLDRILADLKVKSREVNKAALSLEIAVTKRSDVVEQALEEYMALVYKLGLHPNPPAEFSHISFTLELNGAASEPRNLIQGESLRGIIKPAVLAVAEAKRRERGILNDERVKLENDLDVVTVECENLEQEGATMESRIRLTNGEVEEIRETSQKDLNASTMEINRLETELAHARAAAKASGVGVAARLKSLQIAYQEQIEKTDRLRDETVRAIVRVTSDMCNLKEQVSEYLNHLRQVAEEN